MNFKHVTFYNIKGLLLTVLLTAAILTFHFWALLNKLDSPVCLEPYRDGIKTPLNAAFHAQYSDSYTFFGGMNYPYKEHIVAATELPGFAILLKALNQIFPGIHQYVFGLSYLLLLFSIILCAVLLYLIFIKLKTPVWFAIPAAIGLTLLAPQHLRFGPHMGLAPVFVIPAVIYGLLLFERGRKLAAGIFIGLVVIIASLLHFYFFAITVFTISLYFFFSLLRNFSWKRIAAVAPYYGIMVLIPLAFFFFWMIANDPVTDRSPKPWGFFFHHAKWESIFLSMHMPYYQWINDHVIKIEKTDFEGWAYIGMAAGVFVLVAFFRWAGRFFKKPLFDFFEKNDRQFYYSLLGAGIVLAVLSCSEPFEMLGMEWLLDYTGPLRQFRSTGRFAWVFYFVINVLAFAGFYQLFSKWKKTPRIAAFSMLFGVLFFESCTFFNNEAVYSEARLQIAPELVPGQRFTDIPGIDYSKYQAIIPIPYYNVGSNNLMAAGGPFAIQKSLILSEQTGLPVTGAMLTRSSRRQTFNQMQLVTEPYRMPVVIEKYPNDKPLLLLYVHPVTPEDKRRYDHLLTESRLLYDHEDWQLYEMDLASFQQRIENRKALVRQEITSGRLYRHGEYLSTDSVRNFIVEHYDDRVSSKTYFGKGGYEGNISDVNTVWSGSLPNAVAGGSYHMLAWMYVDEDLLAMAEIRIREKDEAGNQLQERIYGVSFQMEVCDPNGWVLGDFPFDLVSDKSKLEVTVTAKDCEGKRLYFDELVIKQRVRDLYWSGTDFLWFNNRFLE